MKELALRYNEFQQDFGQALPRDYGSIIDDIFTASFKKIANGVELVNGKENLLTQLQTVREMSGAWVIELKEVVSSACENKCVICYDLKSEQYGGFEIMAIITSDDGKKIDSVREVYRQYQI